MSYSTPLAHTFSTGAANGSTTSGIDTTGSDRIFCGVVYSTGHVPVLTDSNLNTWTPVGTAEESASNGCQLYVSQDSPTVGAAHTFTVTGVNSFSSVFVQAYSGSGSSPTDQTIGSQGNGFSRAAGSITPTQSNEIVIAIFVNFGSAGGQSMDSGMTLTDTQTATSPTWGSSMGYKIQTTAAAINVTGASDSSNDNAIAVASFKSTVTTVTGSIAVTEANDSFAGSVTHQYAGSISVTETKDSLVAHGQVPRTGHIVSTETTDSLSAHSGSSTPVPYTGITFTPASSGSFISAQTINSFADAVRGTQVGFTIAGDDGKHYSADWDFDGPTLVCAETGAQQQISSATFVADQVAHGLAGIGFFVAPYGCLGIPNTPYFYVWAGGGDFLFGNPTQIVFIRYRINSSGVPVPDGGSTFVYDGAGGNRLMAMNTSGGNGTVWAANVVDGQVYICWESSVNPGVYAPCMTCIPYNGTYSATNKDWVAHCINLSTQLGAHYWEEYYRTGDTEVWDYDSVACIVDNGDTTGSVISYFGPNDIAHSPNAAITALVTPKFRTFDVKFTPSGSGGSWTIGALYNQVVSGIAFPFVDSQYDKNDVFDNTNDYNTPSPLLINGRTFLCVTKPFTRQSDWLPGGVGMKAMLFEYTKGQMVFTGATYKNAPFNPIADFGFGGDIEVATYTTMQAFVAGKEIWGVSRYGGTSGLVYYKLFFFNVPGQGIRFSLLKDPAYVDWASTGDPGDFSSHLDTWWMMPRGSAVFAQTPWVIAYVSQHDTNPSLFMTPKWEWTDSLLVHKSGPKTQVYHQRPHSDVGDFRARVRGKGRAMQLHFESESGKPFNLLGWSIDAQNNSEP